MVAKYFIATASLGLIPSPSPQVEKDTSAEYYLSFSIMYLYRTISKIKFGFGAYSYGCLIDIPHLNGANATAVLFCKSARPMATVKKSLPVM